MSRRKLLVLILCAALFIGLTGGGAQRVRHIPVKGDEIVVVKTAIGIATIIQVPDHPNSVVLGDQEGFKIEYLDQGVTIKPVRPGARSNLYIYTDWRRYNVQLVTESESSSDYVVYLDEPTDSGGSTGRATQSQSANMRWMKLSRYMTNDELRFEVNRIGHLNRAPGNGLLVIEFTVTSKKLSIVRPEWLWLKQKQGHEYETRPIQGLFLSAEAVKPEAPLHGTLQILRKDIDEKEPIRLELIRSKVSFLTLPKAASWK